MNPYYTDYSEYLSRIFPGEKIQKISLDAGLTCPNRDGTTGTGGCIYCNNRSFSPDYCRDTPSITGQIEQGRKFFARKYPEMKYLAYFQAYTNTYGPIGQLIEIYTEAISATDITGLIIGTRPDCMPDKLLCELQNINASKPVFIEYGAETSHEQTLKLINRGHSWQQVADAVYRTSEAGIRCGLHLIAGLPGESAEDVLETVKKACLLPIDTLKIHQLQIIRGTALAKMVESGEIQVDHFSIEEYIDLCARIVGIVPRRIAIERFISQSPSDLLISPKWGLKNYQFTNRLNLELRKRFNI